MFRDLRQEFRPMLTLALPVVLAEMGWIYSGRREGRMDGAALWHGLHVMHGGRIRVLASRVDAASRLLIES